MINLSCVVIIFLIDLIKKRLPRSLPKRKNDIYVTRKTNFAAQIKKCKKLLEAEYGGF